MIIVKIQISYIFSLFYRCTYKHCQMHKLISKIIYRIILIGYKANVSIYNNGCVLDRYFHNMIINRFIIYII